MATALLKTLLLPTIATALCLFTLPTRGAEIFLYRKPDLQPFGKGEIKTMLATNGTLYIGGYFSSVRGQLRTNFAALSIGDDRFTDLNLPLDGTVNQLAFRAKTLFIAGAYTNAVHSEYANLAAFDTQSGLLTDWQPRVDGSVDALVIHDDKLYIGGSFKNVNGQPRKNLASFTLDGKLTEWQPNLATPVLDLTGHERNIYALSYNSVYELNLTSGSKSLLPIESTHPGETFLLSDMLRHDGKLYIVGSIRIRDSNEINFGFYEGPAMATYIPTNQQLFINAIGDRPFPRSFLRMGAVGTIGSSLVAAGAYTEGTMPPFRDGVKKSIYIEATGTDLYSIDENPSEHWLRYSSIASDRTNLFVGGTDLFGNAAFMTFSSTPSYKLEIYKAPSGTVSMGIYGTRTRRFLLESSSDLKRWAPLLTNSPPFNYRLEATNNPLQFFRAADFP